MKYPVYTIDMASSYIHALRSDEPPLNPPDPIIRGEGFDRRNEIDEAVSKSLLEWKNLRSKASNAQARDGVEGQLSVAFFNATKFLHNSPEVLTDNDFWRYLAATHFFEFTEWRDQRTKDSVVSLNSFGAGSKSLTRDCVPFRMFERAYLADLIGERRGDLSFALIPGGDVWKSHILGVLNSLSPSISKVMLERVKKQELKTEIIRPLAKRLKRLRANVLFEILPEEDAILIIDRESQKSGDSIND